MQDEQQSGVTNAVENVETPQTQQDFDSSKPYHLVLKDADEKAAKDQETAQETAPTDEQSEEGKQQAEAPKKMGGYQKQIAKLQAEIAARDAEIAKYRQPQSQQQGQSATDGGPDPRDSKYQGDTGYLDFAKDLARWEAKQELDTRERSKAEEARKQALDERKFEHVERETSFQEQHPDYVERVVELRQSGLLDDGMVEAIIENSDMSEQVAYHLTQYPSDLLQLQPIKENKQAMTLALKQIEAFIKNNAQAAPVAKQTSAPPPVAPVRTSGSTSSRTPSADTSLSDYEKWRYS